MTDDDWVLLGYQAKEQMPKPDWLEVDNVEEIASVSTCIARAPDQTWTDNVFIMMGYYETPELARQSITDNASYTINAYRVSLFVADSGNFHRMTELEMIGFAEPPLPGTIEQGVRPVPIPSDFEFLGYDAVSDSGGCNLGCSPLSCNHLAKEIPVNRYCLIDRLEDAIAAARRFSLGEAEPGNYYVVEVWRESVES
jgi:hypothetical protein